MIKQIFSKLTVLTGCVILLTACSGNSGSIESKTTETDVEAAVESTNNGNADTDTGFSIESMGKEVYYKNSPERIVALGYDLAEMIVMLGEGDRIIGIAPSMYMLEDVKKEYRDEISQMKLLPDGQTTGVPSLETVLSEDPDFVLGYSYSFYENAAGTVDDYISNGINFYATEGTYVSNATIENTYNDFLNLGKILGKEAEAEQIVSDMRQRVKSVEEKVSNKEKISVFVYDYGTIDNLQSIGGVGFQNNLITLAGGENIFKDIESDFAIVSTEELIKRNPDVIVIVEYYSPDAGKEKIDYINSLDELAEINAVKNQNFVVISGYSFFPCGQNVDLIEKLADAFYSD